MKSLKIKLFSIIALAVALVTALGAFIGVNVARADRSVTISGSSIFYTSGNAEVWAHEVPADPEVEGSSASYYSMFVLSSDTDSVNYRKNLAHNWFYNSSYVADDGEGDEGEVNALTKAEEYFNMQIGFELTDGKIPFDKYILTFESQEFSQTKDGKSTNYVIFYPNGDRTQVYAVIGNDIDAELPQNPVALGYDNIKIQFGESAVGGEYKVTVSSAAGSTEGVFENIGSTYAKYSSSSTKPVTPLSFKAEFPEENADKAKMIIYNLNGQSFLLTGTRESDGHRVGGTVNDTVAPVLCLDKGVSFVQLGSEISFKYTVIDVLASSPSLTTSYFMLTKDQAADVNFNSGDYSNEELFRKVADSDDQKMIPHVKTHYVPTAQNLEGTKFGSELEAKALVKICLKLTDTSASGGVSDYVMLDWFVDDEYVVKVNGQNYIAVAEDAAGVTYNYVDDENSSNNLDATWDAKVNEYQQKVTEAAKDLLAGSKNYFYLPSLESLLSDNATEYADMTFSIYYNNGSQQQQSNKAANALSINISKAGRYVFTVYATDSASNDMYYYNKDGEKTKFATGDIWNMFKEEEDSDFEGTRKYLPWFYFDVDASEISIEEPEEQDTAYVGNSYSPDSFEINGVSYKTAYNLYLFNNDEYYKGNNNTALTYAEFMEKKADLLNNSETRKWFTYIYPSSELTEGTEEYEKYSAYAWNSASPSFVPQDDNAFYLIECKVTSTEGGSLEAVAYMGIAAAPKVDPLKGEDTWVQDNMVSIILLCVAGLALIGIVLVVVIKPKEKGDLDEVPVEEPQKKN